MVDSVFRTRSLGVPATGLPDQYADGKAAKVWELYIGCKQSRTSQYREWICNVLRDNGCHTVLDVACGTGVDSCMLLEAGFAVTSTDASDKMLKYALQERWNRRKDDAYNDWVIEEANWLSLVEDFEDLQHPADGFDAVICLGNSFAHLPDFDGSLNSQRAALSNFRDMLKPGGLLIIDHRNYDAILDKGMAPAKNIYYNSDHIVDIKTSNLYVNGSAMMVTLDYNLDITKAFKKQRFLKSEPDFKDEKRFQTFRLSYYPHRLNPFNELLIDVFGDKAQYEVSGDFVSYNPEDVPAYYIHTVKKAFT